ncbi:sigma-70 family RNA polymerase sigma factor [Kitasatospora acidiphila]|uniref:Sigma-70 family RNA polymerase sigma factor n=1 Tax=Kitasatospora acidiphila TaxID=2567942 RepID=A0A540W679_9ACTN|nr:sigma-70 family RNA polymerase sigma factor [Kitasatospora acidiphila]TQF04483.1 sigma-70 family RNA polymerase sigma factor [Kitasatospora acidiphila]
MDDHDWLADRFEADRGQLRAVAYRMLGSVPEAEDAVQEAWLRLSRSDTGQIDNLSAWLTTVVGRVCLDMLRSRRTRREDALDDTFVPDPVVTSTASDTADPEQQALMADSVGLALLVVLEHLAPAERLAFVLHDMFAVPFEEIAPIVGKTPAATRQLASRARRRVQGSAPAQEPDVGRQRAVVDAFMAASQAGDFDALLAVLDPDVLLRADVGVGGRLVRGAAAVASQALFFRQFAYQSHPALINGAYGMVSSDGEQVVSVMSFTVADDRVVELNILADQDRLAQLDLTLLDD